MKSIHEKILSGKIFIYPTDTIYGLGCNAMDKKAVNKIKEIKKRDKNKPLSIIAPSLSWIKRYCVIDSDLKRYFPGPYTVVLKKKNFNFLKWISSSDSLGIRIPGNSLTKKIQKSKLPFVTTSVNLSGQKPITKISEIPEEIRKKVDIIIDEGELSGRPSTLVINGKEVVR